MESFYFDHGGVRLHCVRWGNPQDTPVVMLHGLRAYAQTWEPLAEALGDGFCCYALDQRGRGLSGWAPSDSYRTECYVADLRQLVLHLQLDEFFLIGHSMGGSTALEYVRQYPNRICGLVVEDIGPGSSAAGDGAQRIRREMRETPLVFADWEAAEAFWRHSRPNLSRAGLQSRLLHSMHETPAGIAWRHDQQGIAEARLSIPPIDLWPAIRSLRCPTLLVRGGRSDFLSQETMLAVEASNPYIETVEIPEASHYVHDEQSEMFNRTVTEFIHRTMRNEHQPEEDVK